MSNKLLFTAAVAIGGLLTGALAATGIPLSAHTPSPVSTTKPGTSAVSTSAQQLGGHVVRLTTPQTTGSPGTPPGNDSYSTPTDGHNYAIFGVALDNRDATVEKGETTALSELTGYRAASTVWIKWKAPASGTASLDTFGSTSGMDTSLAVFTGSTLKTAKRIAWNDDSGTNGNLSHIVGMAITKGVTYHIQVGSAVPRTIAEPIPAARTGALAMNFRAHFDEPSNDDIRHAITMTGSSWTANGFTGGSTIESGSENTVNSASPSNPRADSIWYKWTAPAGGSFTVTEPVRTGASYIALYEDNQYKSFRELVYANGAPGASFANLALVGGTTYYFQLGEISADNGGPVSLSVTANYTGPVLTSISPSKGSHKGGKSVILTGTRLTGTTYVYWDVTAYDATHFTVLSDSKIKFTIPAGTKGTRVPVWVYSSMGRGSRVTSATHYSYTS